MSRQCIASDGFGIRRFGYTFELTVAVHIKIVPEYKFGGINVTGSAINITLIVDLLSSIMAIGFSLILRIFRILV